MSQIKSAADIAKFFLATLSNIMDNLLTYLFDVVVPFVVIGKGKKIPTA